MQSPEPKSSQTTRSSHGYCRKKRYEGRPRLANSESLTLDIPPDSTRSSAFEILRIFWLFLETDVASDSPLLALF